MIRQTKQREAITEVLEEVGRPLAPGELYELAKKKIPRIGLRTVYRNIRELVEEGVLIGVDYPGQPMRYEKVSESGPHPHFICRVCHKVIDLPGVHTEVSFSGLKGYEVEGTEVLLYGVCQNPDDCPHRKDTEGKRRSWKGRPKADIPSPSQD